MGIGIKLMEQSPPKGSFQLSIEDFSIERPASARLRGPSIHPLFVNATAGTQSVKELRIVSLKSAA